MIYFTTGLVSVLTPTLFSFILLTLFYFRFASFNKTTFLQNTFLTCIGCVAVYFFIGLSIQETGKVPNLLNQFYWLPILAIVFYSFAIVSQFIINKPKLPFYVVNSLAIVTFVIMLSGYALGSLGPLISEALINREEIRFTPILVQFSAGFALPILLLMILIIATKLKNEKLRLGVFALSAVVVFACMVKIFLF